MRTLAAVAAVALAAVPQGQTGVPNRVTIATAPRVVVYGGTVTLSGTVTPVRAGERVLVAARPVGLQAFSVTASARTDAAGVWHARVRPALGTAYRASRKGTRSGTIAVVVRPRVTLQRISSRRFFVAVSAARPFAGRVVLLQRRSAARWLTVARSALGETATTRLRARLPAGGSLVRAYVPRAVTGYAAGRSAVLAVTT